jgi:hypothetical protein
LGAVRYRSILGKPLALQVRKVNPAARLYARLGFTKAGEDEIYVQMRWEPPSNGSHSVPGPHGNK